MHFAVSDWDKRQVEAAEHKETLQNINCKDRYEKFRPCPFDENVALYVKVLKNVSIASNLVKVTRLMKW